MSKYFFIFYHISKKKIHLLLFSIEGASYFLGGAMPAYAPPWNRALLAELLSTDQLTVSIEHKTGSIGRRWCWLHRALPTRVWLYRESMHAWPNPNGLEGWAGTTLHRGHRFVRGNFLIFKPDFFFKLAHIRKPEQVSNRRVMWKRCVHRLGHGYNHFYVCLTNECHRVLYHQRPISLLQIKK